MSLTAIVKPTHDCNLRCSYCYIDSSAESGRMTDSLLRATMEQTARVSKDKSARFIWHGGEPLLMGVDFYREVASISKSLRQKGYKIQSSIQSNGTLITEELLDFIQAERDFNIGLSLDGPEEVNNLTRKYRNGKGAFNAIFAGLKRLEARKRSEGGGYLGGGVIVVLSRSNLGSLGAIYEFFKKERINCKVNPLIMSGRANDSLRITPQEYAKAMNALFDIWINDPEAPDMDPFTDIMGNLMTGCPRGCNFSGSCRDNFVSIGPMGDVYPCGRFDGIKEFWMGNIAYGGGLGEALSSRVQKRLSVRSAETVPGCSRCANKSVCNSGCMHNAYTAGDVMGKDPYCRGYKRVFRHVEERLHEELAKAEVKNV